MRAAIFPNDPIVAYLKKGEIVPGYHNPCNIFSHVDIISLSNSDCTASEAREIAGTAKLAIYPVGSISMRKVIFYNMMIERIIKTTAVREADVIIAHNSNFAGFLASKIGKRFNIPVIISMHTNPDKDIRAHIGWGDIRKKFFWFYSSVRMESRALRSARKVICAYEFIRGYLLARGVNPKNIEVIYHRIPLGQFSRGVNTVSMSKNEPLKVLCVGRIFERKNPENIIRAVKELNARLTLIGSGPYLDRMVGLVKELDLEEKVLFIRSVPNAVIDGYYKDAHVFACVNDYGGVSKPVMEAMASALPVVMKRPIWEDTPELIEDIALVTDGSARGFAQAFKYLADNPDKMTELGQKAFLRAGVVDGRIMEKREAEAILSVIKKKKCESAKCDVRIEVRSGR